MKKTMLTLAAFTFLIGSGISQAECTKGNDSCTKCCSSSNATDAKQTHTCEHKKCTCAESKGATS